MRIRSLAPADVAPVSFRIYDVDGNGFIDKGELFDILKASLFDIPELHFSDEQLRTLGTSRSRRGCLSDGEQWMPPLRRWTATPMEGSRWRST